ncbi:ABC transporter permease [Flavobacterium salilacus subsp. salilacus]|uniref:ABC transporter permease n=1 Tax=Flavobacterium TaxID=237 RepID=UPI0010751F81|nr:MULTISPECIES: FtsX-like permease family protein [Flavobacterium]KAF2514132.1 ABC transporter permease [Flavobacterium salilacus subsp. salilacus]MBE1615210.1 ABC transporter permease [Flavobacterium sp. SaA2.13]
MNLEYFIARRLVTAKNHKSSISAPIIKIAIIAIAIGIIMMIIAVATGVGLQDKIREKVSAFNGHIIISNYDDNISEVSVAPIPIQQDFYPEFKSVQGISHIQAVASKAGIIRTEESVEGVVFKGVGKDYKWDNLQEYIVSGRIPDLNNNLNNEVILSQYLADRLQFKVGDKFNTFFMKEDANSMPNMRVFEIVGIFNSGFQEFDATYVIGDIRHVQRINKWKNGEVGSFEVFIDDFDQLQQKGDEVYNAISSTLDSRTIEEKYYNIFEWLKLFDFNIVLIIIIMVIVGTINMVVALLVLILERTQMIGMLKALGANNWSVRKIFLYNAAYLIIKGLLWGNIISLGLIFIQKYFEVIKLPPENYYVTVAPVAINIPAILLINSGTVAVCLSLLLIPSYIITKISPVKALRFD